MTPPTRTPKPNRRAGDATKRDFAVPSLERGMAILELLAREREGLGLVELAQALRIPNNGVFRVASALEQLGYLHRDPKSRKFLLTSRLLSVGLSTVHQHNIVERAYELLRQMRDELKEATALATLLREDAMGVVLATEDCAYPYGWRLQVGLRFELHSTGPGKVLLAFLPEHERRQLLERIELKRFTPHTITRRDKLEEELAAIREAGYGLDREEAVVGCHCVAAPVLNAQRYPVAAIWTCGPSERLKAADFLGIGRSVARFAAAISERLLLPA
ncbi:MAG: IclR family transcriptional regulator [Planctomycetota bacterium]|nr:IclR family transcriptional regulator [Planctomycetota bacterium]